MGRGFYSISKLYITHSIVKAKLSTGHIKGCFKRSTIYVAGTLPALQDKEKTQIYYQEDLFLAATMISESAPLDEVIKQMLASESHRVVVVNGAKSIVGIISPKDILAYVFSEEKELLTLRKRIELLEEQAVTLKHELKSTKDVMVKYQKLFEDSPAMVHSVDKDGTIIMANKRLHQTLGYKDNELVGKKLTELYSKTSHAEAMQGLKTIQEKGRHQNIYTTMVTKDGEKIRVDLISSSLKDQHGKFLATITAARPIDSENLLRALHGAFKDSKIEELELEKLVTRFDEE